MDMIKLVDSLDRATQLNAMLENIFINGTCSGIPANDPMIGLAYDLCGRVNNFLTSLEAEKNK